MKKVNRLTKKLHAPNWLLLLLAIVFILRIPSFFEPYSYGDEMIYLILGNAIRMGIPLYSGIHDNKPPLLYIMAAIAGNLFWFKAILTFWLIITIYIFSRLIKILFPKGKISHIIGVSLFALLVTIPLLEGNIINAELFMIGPTILAFFILLKRNPKPKTLLFSGFLFSLSTLFKIPAIFDIPAIIFLWIATKPDKKGEFKTVVKNTFLLFIGFILPILASILWFYTRGSLKEYITAAFLQNIGYLSSWRPGDVKDPFFIKNLPLIIRGLIVFLGLAILYLKRKFLSKNFILATSWLFLSLFAATLSERPYPHYLIQSVAPLSILFTILFSQKSIEQVLTIIPLTIFTIVPFYYHFWYYKTIPYYEKFIKFSKGELSKEEYFLTFGEDVLRNYKISEFIVSSTRESEKIFVWGSNNSTIYALSKRLPPGKYFADYHIKDFSNDSETTQTLQKDLPSFIVILPNAPEISGLQNLLLLNYGLVEEIDKAKIWKLLSPKIRSLISF